ncbi:mechanosensitive ion channel family protein [Niveibacterium umoris]|uniref:Small-conductance mechanosensitive channel n=1 Tax=Niveibacterium umoris TaxID=1193620 RepID=A0A840BNV7_9RHOO|nr:mechanosensitive ion channel family protein [Niveibacterium umoris]MBB4014274.1 small conductance mechanosensitive channel [Niveibacterium umoris]
MNFQNIIDVVSTQLATFGLKILGAIAVWIVGRWLIGLAVRGISAAMTRQHVDPTLLRYIGNIVSVALNIVLVVAILGYFGLETTSFAALVAAMGIAIGAAWAGLLANFAAGAFLVVLRPFKVGDYVKVGGIEGTVMEVGLFASAINTPDNVLTIVGNNKIFGDTIQNYSTNPYRRVERTAQLNHAVDVNDAISRLKAALVQIPNVVAEPTPTVEVLDFTPMGPVLAVRPFCHTNHYWQVYFDTNKAIRDTCGAAGYPVPEQHFHVRQG